MVKRNNGDDIDLNRMRPAPQQDGQWPTPPPFVIDALRDVLSVAPDGPVLDPWVSNGSVLAAVLEGRPGSRGVAVVREDGTAPLARESLADLDVRWKSVRRWLTDGDDSSTILPLGDEKFASFVSLPPWGYRPHGPDIARRVRRNAVIEVMVAAGKHLMKDGLGVFLVPESVMLTQNGSGMDRLVESGLSVEHVLALPPGTFGPHTNIGGSIVVVTPGVADVLFCARLSKNADANRRIIDNARERIEDHNDAARGAVLPVADYRGVEAMIADNLFRRMTRSTERDGTDLGSLCQAKTRGEKDVPFQPEEGAVYLPLIGDGPALHRLDDLTMKPQNYVRIIADGAKVRAQWLAGYLSSPVGVQARRSVAVGTGIKRLSLANVDSIPVLVPSLDEQERAIDADQSLRMIQSRLKEWQTQLWVNDAAVLESEAFVNHQDESFSDWVAQLPFPLATILWTYHTAVDDRKRYEHLLHFFEAAAAFYATILLSAVEADEQGEKWLAEVEKGLSQKSLSFKRATFGTWTISYAVLAKRLRTRYNDTKDGGRAYVEALFKTRDATTISMLLSKRLVAIFESTNSHRNNWKGHGGVVGDEEAERRHRVLRDELVTFREAIGAGWHNYELVLPTTMKYVRNSFAMRVQRVRGAITPFEQAKAELAVPLEDGRLHLLGSGETEAMLLLPFVQLMASPRTSANACYFYNRRDADKARFVSYHFDKEAELKDVFPDVNAALERITRVTD